MLHPPCPQSLTSGTWSFHLFLYIKLYLTLHYYMNFGIPYLSYCSLDATFTVSSTLHFILPSETCYKRSVHQNNYTIGLEELSLHTFAIILIAYN